MSACSLRPLKSQYAKPRPDTKPRKLTELVRLTLKHGSNGMPGTEAQYWSPFTRTVPAGRTTKRGGCVPPIEM